jgi:crotonobetainyl-CoA:carnitine CoA-transferase CaiB-like acyl-CoA transferase
VDTTTANALVASLAGLPTGEVIRKAAAIGIPAVRARRAPELTGDDQLARHGLLVVLDHDEAGVARVGPGRWLEMPGLIAAPPGEAPELGEQSHAILAEIGLTSHGLSRASDTRGYG